MREKDMPKPFTSIKFWNTKSSVSTWYLECIVLTNCSSVVKSAQFGSKLYHSESHSMLHRVPGVDLPVWPNIDFWASGWFLDGGPRDHHQVKWCKQVCRLYHISGTGEHLILLFLKHCQAHVLLVIWSLEPVGIHLSFDQHDSGRHGKATCSAEWSDRS